MTPIAPTTAAPRLTAAMFRHMLELTVAGFGGTPTTNENAAARAQTFVCSLSGMISVYDRELADAIFAVIQPAEAMAAAQVAQ